jgi:hypothetical protein
MTGKAAIRSPALPKRVDPPPLAISGKGAKLRLMITYSIDDAGRVFTLSYRSHVTPSEVNDFLDAVRPHLDRLRPGFVLLSDLTGLKSMDPACAEGVGTIMEAVSERGATLVLRVIPDPSKDIGLNLISLFHYRKPLRVQTLSSLAEALVVLLDEAGTLQPSES